MSKLAQRIAYPVLWTLVAVLPLVGGCGGGESAEQVVDILFDYAGDAEVGDDGTTTEEEGDDIDFEGNEDTVDELTEFVAQMVAALDVDDEDVAAFVEDAAAVVKISADHDVPGSLTARFRVDEWTGTGFDADLLAVLYLWPDETVVFAGGQEVEVDEGTGDTWLILHLPGAAIFTPGHEGAHLLVFPLGLQVAGDMFGGATDPDGDPDVVAGDPVNTECELAFDSAQSGALIALNVFATLEPDDWELDPGQGVGELITVDGTDPHHSVEWDSTCDGSTEEGPEILLLCACTITEGETECLGSIVVHVFTEATCTGEVPAERGDIIGADEVERIEFNAFDATDCDGESCQLVAIGFDEGVEILEVRSSDITEEEFDAVYAADSTGGEALQGDASTELQAASQVEAVVSYGNYGYGITHYDPALGEFGATEIDPSSGSVSDVESYEDDPSRAVLVQSGRNQVRFIELVTDPFSGTRFRTLDTLAKNIPSTLFPGATGYVITATRRNDTSPVYFVTVGATATDPGQLWRKDDPAALLTSATALGAVGASPRRIRFEGPVGVVSNNSSNTLTILTRDASDNVAIKGTVNVGDGPIGVDLLVLPNGNIGILSTGYRDHTYTVTIVEPDGDVVSNETSPVPTGGLNPSSAVWANAEGTRIAVSCHGSNKLVSFSIG